MAAVLKNNLEDCRIGFLGKSYTRPLIEACGHVDEFIDIENFLSQDHALICGKSTDSIIHVFPVKAIARHARNIGIPERIGTTNRIYHWLNCNRLVRLGRKNSLLHEAQLNLKLLAPLGIQDDYSLEEIGKLFGLKRFVELPDEFKSLPDRSRYNLILHPKSQGSAREWGIDHFIQLILSLDPKQYNLFVSGTEKERESLGPLIQAGKGRITDLTGRMNLAQFISFINLCDGLVAASTGPLHISAALGKDAFGIYPPIRPMHPGRWAPLGPGARVFVIEKNCNNCSDKQMPCACMQAVPPDWIRQSIEEAAEKKMQIDPI
jgi:ADP-heptose:LPS heptosyltransferase